MSKEHIYGENQPIKFPEEPSFFQKQDDLVKFYCFPDTIYLDHFPANQAQKKIITLSNMSANPASVETVHTAWVFFEIGDEIEIVEIGGETVLLLRFPHCYQQTSCFLRKIYL